MKEEDHDMEREWLDEVEVRVKTRRERTTLWKLRRDKTLEARKDGPYTQYLASSVDAYLRSRVGR